MVFMALGSPFSSGEGFSLMLGEGLWNGWLLHPFGKSRCFSYTGSVCMYLHKVLKNVLFCLSSWCLDFCGCFVPVLNLYHRLERKKLSSFTFELVNWGPFFWTLDPGR